MDEDRLSCGVSFGANLGVGLLCSIGSSAYGCRHKAWVSSKGRDCFCGFLD